MVNRISQQHQNALLEGGSVGGLIGMVLGRPLLGALGGLAYKLFSTEGLADAAKQVVSDFTNSDDPKSVLGGLLGAKDEPTAEKGEGSEQRKSGLPSWAKIGLGVVAGTTALNFARDNLFNTFMGVPNYGMGFPIMPIMPNMWGMNPYAANMWGASMAMNPLVAMMGQFLPWMR